MIEAGPSICDQCCRPIPPDAPGGLCPNCLFSSQISAYPSTLTGGPDPSRMGIGSTAFISWSSLANAEFGPYLLLEEIGRGGMGVVFRARHRQLDRLVAIKMILAGHTATPQQLQSFLTEAKAAARVRHPNIVGIYEVGQIQGWHFMAMELVEGKNLMQQAREGTIEPDDAARIVRDIASAMSYLHGKGIIHRDIKPSNIVLDARRNPFITDFGLAKVRELSTGLTTEGLLAGTPNYMSPEQATGAPEGLTPSTDVYSLGAVLYEMLTARPPFRGESIPETLMQVVKREPDPPRRLRPAIPPELDHICLKCLEKSPADRYPNMTALSADLERYLDGETISARSLSLPHRIRRWWRRSPGLAARYLCLWLFFSIEQFLFLFDKTPRSLHRMTMIVVPLWTVVSYISARVLRRTSRKEELVRSLWIFADVVFLTGILLTTERLQQSPIVMLYPIYIAAAGLWNRVRAVWLATVLCILSDFLLYLYTPLLNPDRIEGLYVHLVFVACLVILGLVVSHQVRQVRVMRRYVRQRQPSPSS